MKIRISRLIIGFAFFTILCGFRGCYVSSAIEEPAVVVTEPAVVVTHTTTVVEPAPAPVIYMGDIELSVYAPASSAFTPNSERFNVTLREGGAFGATVLTGDDFLFDAFGQAAIDITALPYGYYDLEVVGFDLFGNSVSYAAKGIMVDEAMTFVTIDLEAVTFSGDVVLDLVEPDNGLFAGPIDTIDYTLWEIDPVTNELTFVEQFHALEVDAWSAPSIASLALGEYYIEVFAYDVFGDNTYEFAASFSHETNTTYLPVLFNYSY
jgi:hypothetical protein